VGGFVDAYYAYSFLDHPTRTRSYTTQPLKHNEFSLNLGMVEVQHRGETIRGRFALQTGTYVESNLAAEPELVKHILEASAGTRIGEIMWVDLGVFPSHIGMEGILSKDNWTYSRSLLADYSPYYEAGISLTAAVSENLTLRGLVLNGWQNISETNNDKAVGTQVQFKPSESVLLNWSTFVGNEQPDSLSSRLRVFNDFYGVVTLSQDWRLALVFDIGTQEQAVGTSWDFWHAASLMARHTLDDRWAIGARVEYYTDPKGVIVSTGTENNFVTTGASVNLDFAPSSSFLWRLEVRVLNSEDAIYPSESGLYHTDGFVVLSAALTL
jgi:hypothetical protein